MNQVDRDMTAPLNDELGNFQQSIWTIHWDSMTHEISRHVGLFVALRILNYYCNVHFSLETGVWKNMWKNNGCKKLDNDEILQDRKKHEKKYSQLWHPPNDFHMQSPSPFCIIAPHELLPRTWWTHHARGPPAVQEDQLSNILWKKGKTQATKWTSHDLPVWIDGWLQSISPRFLVVSVNMAAPNDFLSMAVSISPWLTHPSPHGSCAWSVTRSGGSHDRLDGRYGGLLLLFHLWRTLCLLEKNDPLRPRPRTANCPETMFCNTRMIHTQKMPLL